jgi:hypothetical protein
LVLQVATGGMHVAVTMAIRSGAVGFLVGDPMNVKAGAENLMSQLEAFRPHRYNIDVWTPATPDQRPYKFQRSVATLISVAPISFTVCAAPCDAQFCVAMNQARPHH